MPDYKLIVGLGNPGEKYEKTRHNVGFEILDQFARKYDSEIRQKKFNSLYGTIDFEGKKLILLKPQTYMNLSGQAVATAAGFYKIGLQDILVITDDMAIDSGCIRVRAKGSAGGHNGLADIIQKLKSNEISRLRVGIGKSPYPGWKDWVLSKPGKQEREQLDEAYSRSVSAIDCWIRNGIDKTMNDFNG